jgi:hypothetical protein
MAVSVSEHIDQLLSEQPIGMSQAARLLGTFRRGRACHPSTVVRWCKPGVRLPDGRRLRLEHVKVAGRLMTSRPALLRFLAAQQDPSSCPEVKPPRTLSERRRALTVAETALDAIGVI